MFWLRILWAAAVSHALAIIEICSEDYRRVYSTKRQKQFQFAHIESTHSHTGEWVHKMNIE